MPTLKDLNLDIVHMIVNELCNDADKKQALILATVSRSFNIVATRFIYKSIIYRPYPRKDKRKTNLHILNRLSDDHNIRAYVRSFTVTGSSKYVFKPMDYAAKLGMIPGLVTMLPNLHIFTWAISAPPPEGLGSVLQEHNGRPRFHLSLVNCGAVSPDLLDRKCLTSLEASVRLTGTNAILEIEKIFFQSPHLRSFSLKTRVGGKWPLPHAFTNFQLSGQENFPPLERLGLDGYRMQPQEWILWRERMNLSRLTSLTLERGAILNLSLLRGWVQNLKVLRLRDSRLFREDRLGRGDVAREFIRSCTSLIEIELDEVFIDVSRLGAHANLESIAIYGTGYLYTDRHRLSAARIRHLDSNCPRIKHLALEIIIRREQPCEVISECARHFPNLQHLHLHMNPQFSSLRGKYLHKVQEEYVTRVLHIRQRERNAGKLVNDALRVAPRISLSLNIGKMSHRYEEAPPCQPDSKLCGVTKDKTDAAPVQDAGV